MEKQAQQHPTPSQQELQAYLEVAIKAADAAGALVKQRFKSREKTNCRSARRALSIS